MNEINLALINLKNGESKSLETLYLLMNKQVYLLAYSILKDKFLAEDVLHEVFIRIKNKNALYKNNTNGVYWIQKITRNLCIDILRKRNKEKINIFDVNNKLKNIEHDTNYCYIEQKYLIDSLLSSLNQTDREIILLYIISNLKHKEISKLLNISYATVRWRYSKSLKKIKKIYQESEVLNDE